MNRLLACALVLTGFGAATALAAEAPFPIPAPAVIQRACVGCHDMAVTAGRGHTAEEWSEIIDRMVDRGVDASPTELAAVKAYLIKAMPAGAEGPPKALQAP